MFHSRTPLSQLTLLFCCVLCFSVYPRVSSAVGHTLSPAVIDVEVEPRDIVTQTIVIENTSGVPMTLFPSVNNVTTGVEGGMQEFVAPSMSDRDTSLASWMEIGRSGVELAAGERKEIPLTIRVAPGAKPGGYHAMIAFASGTTVDDAMPQIQARTVPITFINATIVDKKTEWLNLSRFTVKKFITSFTTDTAHYQVENSGDTELVPSGDILISNQRGEEVASIPVNPEKRSVSPGETVTFSTGIPIDTMLGKYKAYLTLKYGGKQAAVYDTVFFFAFPWKKVAFAFGVFLLSALSLAIALHYRYEKKRRWMSEESDDDDESLLDPDMPVAVPLILRDTQSVAHHKDVIMKK